MLRTNDHYGIMALHNAKMKNEPKPPAPELFKRQWTDEERLRCQNLKPPNKSKLYQTTAYQRPVPMRKREIDIWEDKP